MGIVTDVMQLFHKQPEVQKTPEPAPNPNPDPKPEVKPITPVSPLDSHKDLWQTPEVDPNAAPQGLFTNLDPVKVQESANKLDFSKSITPEILAKVAAGGTDATSAFLESLNSVARTVYAQSAIATTKIVEKALEEQSNRTDGELATKIRKLSASEGLRDTNPILSDPAVQPIADALTERYATKFPKATSKEIEAMVLTYIKDFSNVFAPPPEKTPAERKTVKATTDWNKFLQG